MAKKEKSKKSVGSGKVVRVNDLAQKYGMEARIIRQLIRGLGLKAPTVEREEGKFGPNARYEWKEGDSDLAKIEATLKEAKEKGIGTPRKRKEKEVPEASPKKKRQAKEEDDDDEDEDEEEEEADDDEDEDEDDDDEDDD